MYSQVKILLLANLVLMTMVMPLHGESSFRCFGGEESLTDVIPPAPNNRELRIGLQVTNRTTHQLMTRIFSMFLKEVLHYRDVRIISINNTNFTNATYHTLDSIRRDDRFPNINMINLEVWMPYSAYRLPPENISDSGASITPGRFGWFVPRSQISSEVNPTFSLHYEVFRNMSNPYYDLYVIDDISIQQLLQNKNFERFESPRCRGRTCATIIAEFRNDSQFIERQISETGSFLNVIWLGHSFRETVRRLSNTYKEKYARGSKRLLILHWTPSDVIDDDIKFDQITMPRCEDYASLQQSNCKYELTPILKYYAKSLSRDKRLMHALRYFFISDENLTEILSDLRSERESQSNSEDIYNIYNTVACNWMQRNKNTYKTWETEDAITLWIGGIFPINMTSRGHQNIIGAVKAAVESINKNKTVLPGYNLEIMINNGQCKSDMVMKAFIHYFNLPNILGVLGPACSETVEPIAGISKHMNMMVMSYSAEGASFVNRQAYPYFFRTIGSNSQYEDVYLAIMEKLGWKRVAALTEDGHKYSEYISHMEDVLKLRNFKLITNRKFRSDVTAADMREHLLELKEAHAKIIIADVHNRNAAMALCEAKKLGMTQREEYVWFLPSWLSKNFESWQELVNNSCTAEDLREAIAGHFSIMHSPYGRPDAIMQEGITIKDWLSAYKAKYGNFSDYVGYAYDAVWVYAKAARKLLLEDKDAFSRLRTNDVVNRFAQLIWETNFEGLSGNVSFGQGGSRIISLDILQWRNTSYVEVGKYYPRVKGSGSYMRTQGGQLIFNPSDVHWIAGKVPEDGKYDCSFSSLARTLDGSCDFAAMVFSITMCLLAVVVVSLISFLFWKQRYDRKLRRSAKIMKTFGIDLLSPSRNNSNTLDKWEIPKENVVVNRRLGEGAFGTVYGGEAQLGSGDWTAVAVKTLKAGASTEDRIDFLSEAEAMKRFNHKNIIKLLAVCLQSEPIYTIMEFMLYGDLKTYLLARRNMVNEKATDESDISSKRLTMYAMDVVKGLAYLAEQKYVHRDLACRNCLVNAQRVVKIGDFGMARSIFDSDYYRFNRKAMLPVRWMAPEALALGLFTPASDMWAFGVVLFEIISFGSYPYQGLTNNQVLEYVKNGNTLQIPIGVKPQLEGLLKAVWSKEATKRPTALEVIDYISNYPRLLTPSLDFPGAAVEMAETESDQLELLPKIRKGLPLIIDSTLDILSQTNSATNLENSNFNCESNPSENGENGGDGTAYMTPEGYSVMFPLLMHQMCDNSDSSQALLIKTLPSDNSAQKIFSLN